MHHDDPYFTEISTAYDLSLSLEGFPDDVTTIDNVFRETLSRQHSTLTNKEVYAEFWNVSSMSASNAFRRNIALRLNRVLVPARNAQIFSHLYCALLSEDLVDALVDMSSYVGFSTPSYFNNGTVSLNCIATYMIESMLELNLEVLAWHSAGRPQTERPLSSKEAGASPQEWFYAQIIRPDTNLRIRDMLLAVLRFAMRYGITSILRDNSDKTTLDLVINLAVNDRLMKSGIGIDSEFVARLKHVLETDLQFVIPLLPSCRGKVLPVVTIRYD